MLVTRFGKTVDVPGLTTEMLMRIESRNVPIQDVVPDLPREWREFFITGITPEEWLAMFGPPPSSRLAGQ